MSDIVFADAETRSLLDVTKVGAYKYARHPSTEILVWGFVFDDEDGDIWSPSWAWGNTDCSRHDEQPERLLEHIAEGGLFVAWNAHFDRHIWNEVMVKKYKWPKLDPDQVLCAQAQAEANNLPGKLEKACLALGTPYRKDPKGARLINQLSPGDKSTWDSEIFETPEKMGHFRRYCLYDCLAMRDVWQCTRPLIQQEWDEYHASEVINDRGVMVDVEFARHAMDYALAESQDLNLELAELTGDPLITVTNHIRKARYLHDNLYCDQELQELTERPPKDDGKPRFSCDRPTREAILDLLTLPDHSERFDDNGDSVVRFLEIIEAGNSAAVRKFSAIVNQECAGRVHGGYSFNGAGQTGRFCVSAETLIETVEGLQRIDRLSVGTLVKTHIGRFRPVVAKCTKGRETMYEVTFAHGDSITCTANHRLLINGEWQRVNQQNAFKQFVFYKAISRLLFVRRLSDYAASIRQIWGSLSHGIGCAEKAYPERYSYGKSWREQITLEDGATKSDVRCSNWWRNTPRKIFSLFRSSSRQICWSASSSSYGSTWIDQMAGWVGSTPYQRRSYRQPSGQFSGSDEAWASIVTQPEITRITEVGTRTVWDITVAEDHSYISARVANHNSSRGIQVHNLIRDPVDRKDPNRAIDGMDDIIDGAEPDELKEEYGFPVSRLLARLIRPTFIAPEGKTLVWSDWEQIEARVLPWLAKSPLAERKLDLFRAGEDVYKYAAMPIFGAKTPTEISPDQRQVGKVAELALGFGGSVGAFSAMGRNYGVILPEHQVKDIVQRWRAANRWCVSFWEELWGAVVNAYNQPGQWFAAGRVHYLFHPQLMKGTLICKLPDGRWLVYPQFKHERVVEEDEDGRERVRLRTSFMKGFGSGAARVDLWYGMLAENITQAVGASFLRMAVVDLQDWIVLHTHDEVVCEVDTDQVSAMEAEIEDSMTYLPEWAEGLPLAVEIKNGPFYTK